MHTMKATIIRNPISGNLQRQQAFNRAVQVFVQARWQLDVWETVRKGHARELAEKAARTGSECVIVAGGDGSIGQVVDGLLRSRVPDVQLGVIPMGTGNVFAREMGLPFPTATDVDAPARAARIILANEPVRLDVGQAGEHIFLCWAGVGLDAAITDEIESQLVFKRRAPVFSYATTTLRYLMAYHPAHMTIQLADGEILEGDFPLVLASNIRLYARYFQMSPEAKINDGLLDLLIFTDTTKLDILYRLARVAISPNDEIPGLIRRQTPELTITADPPQPYHLDGDPLGQTPLTIRSRARSLPVRLNRAAIAQALL
jgi:YegS/Rv2252/BmrU family lipid kinase